MNNLFLLVSSQLVLDTVFQQILQDLFWKNTVQNYLRPYQQYQLIQISETLNAKGILDNVIIVSFDIVNMCPSIHNNRSVATVNGALDPIINLSPSTECIIKALEICLTNNNSNFASQSLKQMEQQLILVLTQILQFNRYIIL